MHHNPRHCQRVDGNRSSGIEKIQQHCLDAGLFEPIYEEYQGFQVVFRKDIYGEEYLRSLNLNDRQIKAVMYVKEKGQITNTEYQDICKTSNRTASRDLADMVASGFFEQAGSTGKGTSYIRGQRKGAKGATKAP